MPFLKTSPVTPDWTGEPCIVAATGPSLSPEIIDKVRWTRWLNRFRVIAVNDAYKVMPWADAMYACDNHWWLNVPRNFSKFSGEMWTTHEETNVPGDIHGNDAREVLKKFPNVRTVYGRDGSEFSFDQNFIRYGHTSGFQSINLALLKGCRRIVLVGFDSRHVDGKAHFFGDHPKELHTTGDHGYRDHVKHFARAAECMPKDVKIINATPGSAIKCFPIMSFEDACREAFRGPDDRVYSDRPEPHAAAG